MKKAFKPACFVILLYQSSWRSCIATQVAAKQRSDNRKGSMLLREDVVQKEANRNVHLCEAERADCISRIHASALHASPTLIRARPPKEKMLAAAPVFSEERHAVLKRGFG